jgi:hypothetical protein
MVGQLLASQEELVSKYQDYVAWNGRMNDELEGIWKKAIVV